MIHPSQTMIHPSHSALLRDRLRQKHLQLHSYHLRIIELGKFSSFTVSQEITFTIDGRQFRSRLKRFRGNETNHL